MTVFLVLVATSVATVSSAWDVKRAAPVLSAFPASIAQTASNAQAVTNVSTATAVLGVLIVALATSVWIALGLKMGSSFGSWPGISN
jgi:hypothetical protein